jgi:tetratricopeptide (TPR) repeat protein
LAVFEEHLPASHHCSIQCFIHLARSYQHAEQWVACSKLCARATEKLDTNLAGGQVKQALITLLCCQGLACFRTRAAKKRYEHAMQCYRRALNIVREMSHVSWRPVEMQTIHDFASELISAERYQLAKEELAKALALLERLEHPPRPPRDDDDDDEEEEEEEEEEPPPPPQIGKVDAALSRCNLMRTLAQAQRASGQSSEAEQTLTKAMQHADSVGKDGAQAQEFTRRELVQHIYTQPPPQGGGSPAQGGAARAREAEPLLRRTLELLQVLIRTGGGRLREAGRGGWLAGWGAGWLAGWPGFWGRGTVLSVIALPCPCWRHPPPSSPWSVCCVTVLCCVAAATAPLVCVYITWPGLACAGLCCHHTGARRPHGPLARARHAARARHRTGARRRPRSSAVAHARAGQHGQDLRARASARDPAAERRRLHGLGDV